jgi:DNA repair protein RecN (Recombination protein N)
VLTHLRIKNLALASDLALELRPGFNAITGETGAGKSILIGALNLLLGQRADRTLIRSGCDSCTVEAVLDISRLRAPLEGFLTDNGLEACENGELLLKRAFTATGTNRQFINGSPVSLQNLASLGDWLVDIHGPHDHQSLFQPARQLELLDAFAGLQTEIDGFAKLFDQRTRLESEKAALVVDEATYARQLDLLRHQVREIDAARLQPGEEDTLEHDHQRARNAARLLELAQEATAGLADNEDSLLARAGALGRSLLELSRLDPAAAELADIHGQAIDSLRELQSRLSSYADRIDLDPARLQELEERVNLLHTLRRKYGSTVPDILQFAEEARTQLAQLEGRDTELVRLNQALADTDAELRRLGTALTAARRKAIPKLSKAVAAQLKDLGFKQSEFGVELRPAPSLQRRGLDVVEFQFAPNTGEPARPLRAIASSGELARVMLALKTVLAAQDDVPVLVFDEVDANVGGETAHAVGAKMRQIGSHRQVLCITHLAPVAAAGETHLVVSKSSREGRTISEITRVEGPARTDELARMLGGGPAALAHAQALLAAR